MTARRAQRAGISAGRRSDDVLSSDLPACLRVGPCVDVWAEPETFLHWSARKRCSSVRERWLHAKDPDNAAQRLNRGIGAPWHIGRPGGVERLARYGLGLEDVPQLRAEADRLHRTLPAVKRETDR